MNKLTKRGGHNTELEMRKRNKSSDNKGKKNAIKSSKKSAGNTGSNSNSIGTKNHSIISMFAKQVERQQISNVIHVSSLTKDDDSDSDDFVQVMYEKKSSKYFSKSTEKCGTQRINKKNAVLKGLANKKSTIHNCDSAASLTNTGVKVKSVETTEQGSVLASNNTRDVDVIKNPVVDNNDCSGESVPSESKRQKRSSKRLSTAKHKKRKLEQKDELMIDKCKKQKIDLTESPQNACGKVECNLRATSEIHEEENNTKRTDGTLIDETSRKDNGKGKKKLKASSVQNDTSDVQTSNTVKRITGTSKRNQINEKTLHTSKVENTEKVVKRISYTCTQVTDSENKDSSGSKSNATKQGGNDDRDNRVNQEDVRKISSDSASVNDLTEASTLGTEQENEIKTPYYLENFKLMLETVMLDKFDKKLFNDEDMKIIEKFNCISESEQKLFIRLLSRKHRWLPKLKISYPKINPDLTDELNGLADGGFIQTEHCLQNTEEVLNLLSAPQIKDLAKSLHLNISNLQRAQVVQLLMKHGKQKTVMNMFQGKGGGTSKLILKKAKVILGQCYKVADVPRGVFLRVLMLFSLTTTALDDDLQATAQAQLFNLLMTNIGKVVYPVYTVDRETSIFGSRDDVLHYQASLQFEHDVFIALEKKDFQTANDIYTRAKQFFTQHEEHFTRHVQHLPSHLTRYTAGHVFIRVLSQGVEVLEKLRKYSEAVDQLQQLLAQDEFCPTYRGRWWDRLALDLETHLKQPGKALDAIICGLADPLVRTGHRYALHLRARRICSSPSNTKLKDKLEMCPHEDVQEAPKVVIQGRLCPTSIQGSYFITQDSYSQENPEDVTVCRVEELCLEHYRSIGYPEGIHGEGSTYRVLFGLLMYDIIFMPGIPDVFHNPYQGHPLDLHTDEFYLNRKQVIDERLEEISASSVESLQDMAQECWEKHNGETCGMINWERFTGIEQIKGLLSCLGSKFLAGVLKRLCEDVRHCSAGMPDLLVWNTETKMFKIVEVKGPNDRLSTKQILWLDYFLKLGADAEVCHVEAVGAKKLQRV